MILKFRAHLYLYLFGLFLILLLSIFGFIFASQLSPNELIQLKAIVGSYKVWLLTPLVLLVVLIIGGIKWVIDGLLMPIFHLRDEMTVAVNSNSFHQAKTAGIISPLSALFNEQSAKVLNWELKFNEQIKKAKGELEKEKDLLAFLIEELGEGIVICNKSGNILLYNKTAKILFNHSNEGSPDRQEGDFIGLGKSITELINSQLIVFTMNDLIDRCLSNQTDLTQQFVIHHNSLILKLQTLGLINQNSDLYGFIFIFEDISNDSSQLKKREIQTRRGIEKFRSGLANIQVSIENIIDYPKMAQKQQAGFLEVIKSHAIQLSSLLDHQSDHESSIESFWILEEVSVREWLVLWHNKISAELAVDIDLELDPNDCHLRLDRYLFSKCLDYLVTKIIERFELIELSCRQTQNQNFCTFDIVWKGGKLHTDELRSWITPAQSWEPSKPEASVLDVLLWHETEIWAEEGALTHEQSYVRLFLPKILDRKQTLKKKEYLSPGSRPEFYDFDLFEKTIHQPELDRALLTDLTYTVFDTETTGLDPSGGDEIISIGAFKIVNGKLLENEKFDQLIDPQRTVPPASTRIHGLTKEHLKGKPTLEVVLPRFEQFAKNTVLIAHNGAFDLRFLEIKESLTGIRFNHPILDTLILSSLISPHLESHNLEVLAERYHLAIKNRHSALDDALLTGRIFLKMVALLAEKNITTLKEAEKASRETYYARIKY
jgi:DNA polymerase III subunit epsilon